MLNNKKYSILKGILLKLLEEVDNKYCADCHSKGPRWASCTLGIFVCVRCAGIHRNMGVHISRIKSVDYDNWTVQQVATMKEIGNSRGRAIYEATLDDNFSRPQTNFSLDQFIRSKYEFQRFLATEQKSVAIRKLKKNPSDKIVNCNTGANLRTPLLRIDNTVNPDSEMNDTSDIDDDFGDFISPNQEFILSCQTTGSATEPSTVSPSLNNSTMGNDTAEISNSSALSGVDTEAYENTFMQSDSRSQEYAMNGNNHSVPGQINCNNLVDVQWHQLINNSGITGNPISQPVIPILQPAIPILQLMPFVYYIMTNWHLPAIPESLEDENSNIQNHPYNDLQDYSFDESLENPDSDFIVPIPESQYEFSIAYEETGTDNYPNREMSQLFTMLFE